MKLTWTVNHSGNYECKVDEKTLLFVKGNEDYSYYVLHIDDDVTISSQRNYKTVASAKRAAKKALETWQKGLAA